MPPLLVRVVDYVGNPGGGVRFAVELLRALGEVTSARLELVSHGEALARYRALLGEVPCRDLRPERLWRSRTLLQGVPGAGPLNWLLRTPGFHYRVPRRVFDGCDLVWLPWVHRHRIPSAQAPRAVGSLHDVIALDIEGILPPRHVAEERETLRGWLRSGARVIVSAQVTAARLSRLFAIPQDRVEVVPLSGQHARPGPSRACWPFLGRPYLFAPVNVTRHKNHEALLQGVGAWGGKHPLVLTGSGADLWTSPHARSKELARLAEAAGLRNGASVFALGYVSDADYYRLLDEAWALVMPTLAEGGGSFPVWEALSQGVPVVSSDIPVMREMVGRIGGQVLWFDPRDPASLAARLHELERDYVRIKARSLAQVPLLQSRTWRDVAKDYARVMGLPLRGAHG